MRVAAGTHQTGRMDQPVASMQCASMQCASLWFVPAAVAAARVRLAEGHPLTVAIMTRARAAADNPAAAHSIGGAAAVALIDRDATVARSLADRLIATSTAPQDLGLAHRGLQLAVTHECAGPLLDATRQAGLRAAAADVVIRLRSATSTLNPHAVQNNWWGVTHGGALLAALVADHADDHAEEIRWALGRCLAFCQHVGAAGLYHEGLGYQLYTLSHLLPALAAADHRGLLDLRQECPWIMRLAESLFAFTSLRPTISDSSEPASGHGMMLSWNDAGFGWPSSNVSPLMLAYADPTRRGVLGRWSAQLEGECATSGDLYAGWEGWPFALVMPPGGETRSFARLRTHVSDPRQGLAVFRDRWHDGDDALLGCYARSTHAGGHSQDDGGSVRLMALGHDWIIGGGQARGAACWQSVVTPVEPAATPPRKAGLGAVIWDERTPGGGVFGMDLRRVSLAYHERYCALAGDGLLGVPVVAALLDLIDDHLGRAWTWRITIPLQITCSFADDGAGFTLWAADGTQAVCRFPGQVPLGLRLEECPASARTFANGHHTQYPQRTVIAADFPAQPHLAIMAVFTIARAQPPAVSLTHGLDIAIGDTVWQRPFSAAVPAGYDLSRGGTLSRWPSGRPAD